HRESGCPFLLEEQTGVQWWNNPIEASMISLSTVLFLPVPPRSNGGRCSSPVLSGRSSHVVCPIRGRGDREKTSRLLSFSMHERTRYLPYQRASYFLPFLSSLSSRFGTPHVLRGAACREAPARLLPGNQLP